MHRLGADVDSAEGQAEELPHRLVVVAGDVSDARALARLAQDLLDHVVVVLVPEPAALQLPAVDDVAYEIQVAAVGVAQEIEQARGLAARRTKVDVGNEDGAKREREVRVLQLIRVRSFHGQAIVLAAQVNRVSAA